jgi:hypothetical protein
MGGIYKRGRYWYINLRFKGQRIRKKVGPSEKIAQIAPQDAEVKVARQVYFRCPIPHSITGWSLKTTAAQVYSSDVRLNYFYRWSLTTTAAQVYFITLFMRNSSNCKYIERRTLLGIEFFWSLITSFSIPTWHPR